MSITYKPCILCGNELSEKDFVLSRYYNSKGLKKTYFRSVCKECYNKQYLEKNLDYYKQNKEYLKEKMRQRYKIKREKREKMREYMRQFLDSLLPLNILSEIVQT